MANAIMRESGVWRLGIHGARGAGKTCYLAALYGFRAAENCAAVSFADEQTIDYLSDKWDHYLAKGEKPQPNPLAMPSELRCHLKADQRVWQVALRDYAGELVQRRGGDDMAELRVETREWLKECNAILFFLDITEPESDIRERLNELDLLLAELHKLSADGNTIARPLSLVLTKWDSRTDFDVCHADAAAELEMARAFLQHDTVLGQFRAALEQSGDRVAVFPVSAFGSHRDGQMPPANGPEQPFNIHAPLLWSVTKAEEMIAKKAERDADRLLDHWWPRYAPAIRELQRVVTAHRLNRGSVHAQLAKRIRSLRWMLWRRRLKAMAAAAILIVVGASLALFLAEQARYHQIVRDFDDPSIGSADLKALHDEYLRRRNPFMGLLGNSADVRKHWADGQDAFSKRDYQSLEGFRRDHPLETDAASRLAKDKEYLHMWGGSSYAAVVTAWKMEDEAAAEKYRRKLEHDSQHQQMLQAIAALAKANKHAEMVETYRRFLGEFPESPHRADIEGCIVITAAKRDDFRWKQVVDFDQMHPTEFEETIKQAGDYIGMPDTRHHKDAEALITRTEERWDWSLYEQVRNASRTGMDANAVESVQRKATTYLNATQPRKQMKAQVQNWLDWFDGFQAEKDYCVVVRSMDIPAGSVLDESNPCCKVQISLNSTSYSTDWAYGKKPVYGATLGPYRFTWGQQGTFHVRIQESDWPEWDDVAQFPHPETDDRFILGRLNGPVSVRDTNGKEIIVYLECDKVIPPPLPAYKDR